MTAHRARCLRVDVFAATILTGVTLTACGHSEAPAAPVGVGIVVGARSNTTQPDWDAIAVHIPGNLPAGSRVAAVTVDGTPDGEGIFQTDVSAHDYSGDSQDADHQLRVELKKAITTAAAASGEADTLGAISAAAASLSNITGPRRIIISDSMFSTAGEMAFQNDLLRLAPEGHCPSQAGRIAIARPHRHQCHHPWARRHSGTSAAAR